MKKKGLCALLFTLYFLAPSPLWSTEVHSWKQMRDTDIVKQETDISCGLASLATILNLKFGLSLTEKDMINSLKILNDIGPATETETKKSYSLLDLQNIAKHHGYDSRGIALDFDNLQKASLPFLAYVLPKNRPHFTVIKSIDHTYVYLADPSWGNTKISHDKFINMFRSRDSTYYGKGLMITTK